MLPMTSPHRKRKRGVILTTQGFRKLQAARSEAEVRANAGQRYTLEDLSERTGLSVDTVMKVLACEVGVDRQTLKNFFQAFRLPLKQSDFTHPGTNPGSSNSGDFTISSWCRTVTYYRSPCSM